MPTSTPNRGYPAPVNSDPADVPQALQDLAEAIDADLATIEPTIHQRPFFRVTASSPQKMIFSTQERLQFTDLEANTNGALLFDPVMPVTEVRPTAGYWWLTSTCSYGAPPAGTLDEITFRMFSSGVAGLLTGSTVHVTPPAQDGTRTISVSTLTVVNGSDDIFSLFDFHRVGIDPALYTLFSRSLTGTKVSV